MGYRSARPQLGDLPPDVPDTSDSDGLLAWIRNQTADFRALGPRIQQQAQEAKIAQGYAIQNGDTDSAAQFQQMSADSADNYNTWNTARNWLDTVNGGLSALGLPGLGVVPYIIAGVVLATLAVTMYAVYQHYDDAQQRLDALKSGALTGAQYAAVEQGAAGGVGGTIAGILFPLALVAGAVYVAPKVLDRLGKRGKR